MIRAMKIQGSNPLRNTPVKRAKSGGASDSGGFARALGDGDHGTAGSIATSAPIGSVDALIALQEVDEDALGRRQATDRAEELLDRLEELRQALLLGEMPKHRLEELAVLARSRRARVKDPHLVQILDDIDLRVQVELAKLSLPA